jgi:multifunctional methyltransferase subunit TRM112
LALQIIIVTIWMIDKKKKNQDLEMKLLTHNMLASNVPSAKVRYPLGLVVTKFEVEEVEYDRDFLLAMMSRIDYPVLVMAASTVNIGLPQTPPDDAADNDEFMQLVHRALLAVDVQEGHLICPSTKREYPIAGGIPNMLIDEDEADSSK